MDWRKILGPSPREFFRGEKRAITELPWRNALPFNLMPSVNYDSASQSQALQLGCGVLGGPAAGAVDLDAAGEGVPPRRRRPGSDGVAAAAVRHHGDGRHVGAVAAPLRHLAGALRGNAYGYVISRDGFGFPTVVDWLNPQSMCAGRPARARRAGWSNGRPVPRQDIVHIPFFTLPGERLGMSPIGAYARTLGVGLQAQAYAVDWFGAGGFPPGTFKNTEQTITQDQADEIKARLGAAMAIEAAAGVRPGLGLHPDLGAS